MQVRLRASFCNALLDAFFSSGQAEWRIVSLPQGSNPAHTPGRAATLVEAQETPLTLERSKAFRAVTLIETADPVASPAPVATASAVPTASADVTSQAELYRPTARPSVAILTVCDDGSDEGEVIRIRSDKFVIGRVDGDLLLPHDNRVSSRHLEIARRSVPGGYRWVLTDLKSTNGLFIRVRRALLVDGSEFLVGNGKYRFGVAVADSAAQEQASQHASRGQTVGWSGEVAAVQSPTLVEMVGAELGEKVVLMRPEYWIGSDPKCSIRRPDDQFCEAKHARLQRMPTGEWVVENNRTRNGLWLRMNQVEVEAFALFQIGEQRFRLKTQ